LILEVVGLVLLGCVLAAIVLLIVFIHNQLTNPVPREPPWWFYAVVIAGSSVIVLLALRGEAKEPERVVAEWVGEAVKRALSLLKGGW